jgi:hypothetical protein
MTSWRLGTPWESKFHCRKKKTKLREWAGGMRNFQVRLFEFHSIIADELLAGGTHQGSQQPPLELPPSPLLHCNFQRLRCETSTINTASVGCCNRGFLI